MRETKRRMEFFSMYDCTGIAAHLEKMALKGWALEKPGTFLWRYRRMEPKKLRYAVVYLPGSSEFDAAPTEENQDLQAFCAEAGWVQVGSVAQMHIFCNESEDPVPIETDAMVQIGSIHAAMKRNFIPSQIVLLLLAAVNLGMRLWEFSVNPLKYLSSASGQVTISCWLMVIALTVTELFCYFRWRRRALAAAREDGTFLPTRSTRIFQRLYFILLGLLVLSWFALAAEPREKFLIAAMLAVLALIFAGVFGVKHLCKKLGAGRNVTRILVFGTAVVMSFAVIGAAVFGVLRLSDEWFGREVETYDYQGITFEVYHDELPLYVEDLTDTSYDRYSTYMVTQRSLLLTNRSGLQRPRVGDTGGAMLGYNIYDVRFGFLRNWVRQELIDTYADVSGRRPTDFPVKGVLVSDLYPGEEGMGMYVLTWKNRVVLLSADWNLTDEQLATAVDTLMLQ